MLISTKSAVILKLGEDVTEDNLQYWIETHSNYVDTVVIVGGLKQTTIEQLENAFKDTIQVVDSI